MPLLHGIVKIASKMGISTLQSYQSSQIFEAIGIRQDVIDQYFTNTVSRVGGIGLEEIGEGVEYRHSHAFDPLGLGVDTTLDSLGFHNLRSGEDKEDHMYNPATIIALREATQHGDYERFREYTDMVDDERRPHTLRGLAGVRLGRKRRRAARGGRAGGEHRAAASRPARCPTVPFHRKRTSVWPLR